MFGDNIQSKVKKQLSRSKTTTEPSGSIDGEGMFDPDAEGEYSQWQFPGQFVSLTDGDTATVTLDLGFNLRKEITVRLLDVDTHEVHFVSEDSMEYKRGMAQKQFVKNWFENAQADYDGEWPLIVYTEKTGKYGRHLAHIERRSDGQVLNTDLLDEFGPEIEY